jgi:methionyl-tRNA formyltransferase
MHFGTFGQGQGKGANSGKKIGDLLGRPNRQCHRLQQGSFAFGERHLINVNAMIFNKDDPEMMKRIDPFFRTLVKDAEAQAKVAAVGAEVMVVAAYGLILPQAVLDMPRLGCINIHGSLLPRWRGAAPIQRALLAGDAETGVCIMQMEAGLDTGPVLLRGAFPIAATDTTATLHDRLAELGARLVVEALGKLPLPAEPQPADGVTYAHKIEKSEALIDWTRSAAELDRHIRAFNPFPGAQALFRGQTVKLWQASPVAGRGETGTILAVDRNSVVIACGEGALAVTELQKAGGKRLPVQQFLAGHPLAVGDRFDIPT